MSDMTFTEATPSRAVSARQIAPERKARRHESFSSVVIIENLTSTPVLR
jgi:hypothetical protein